jgi:hypothetical protein
MEYQGLIGYDEKDNVTIDVYYHDNKFYAFLHFSGVRIDLSHLVSDFMYTAHPYPKMSHLMWKEIIRVVEIEKVKKHNTIFTRLEAGSGYKILRHRMSQIIDVIYNRWYTPQQRKEMEKRKHEQYYDTNIYW